MVTFPGAPGTYYMTTRAKLNRGNGSINVFSAIFDNKSFSKKIPDFGNTPFWQHKNQLVLPKTGRDCIGKNPTLTIFTIVHYFTKLWLLK